MVYEWFTVYEYRPGSNVLFTCNSIYHVYLSMYYTPIHCVHACHACTMLCTSSMSLYCIDALQQRSVLPCIVMIVHILVVHVYKSNFEHCLASNHESNHGNTSVAMVLHVMPKE